MGVPVSEFNQFPLMLAKTDLDSATERLNINYPISTGDGNELDFGSVDITSGPGYSSVRAFAWQVTNFDGNSKVQNFRFWLSSNGLTGTGSKVCYDTWTLDTDWVQNAEPGDVGSTAVPSSEPETYNVLKATGGANWFIESTANDTTQAVALYVYADSDEPLGTYRGTDSGMELQFTFKYDYL